MKVPLATSVFIVLSTICFGDELADRQRRAESDLQKEEIKVAAATRQFATTSPSTQEFRAKLEAAKQYARSIAGNDKKKYVLAARAALNVASQFANDMRSVPSERSAHALSLESIDVNAIGKGLFEINELVENTAKLLEDPGRIYGGQEDDSNEFADCVAVGGPFEFCCTGTLIAPNVVVTAGHCYGPCTSRIYIGRNVKDPSGEIINVAHAVRHPDYHKNGAHNDLTVLILERDVKTVTPRQVASAAATDAAKFLRIVGYGNTDMQGAHGYGIRRKVDAPVATINCAGLDPVMHGRLGCDADVEFVLGHPLLDVDSCNGDSGGPVYTMVDGKWFVCGATSRPTNESIRACGDGGIYVRLDRYLDWIKSVPGGHWSP